MLPLLTLSFKSTWQTSPQIVAEQCTPPVLSGGHHSLFWRPSEPALAASRMVK
jgi:hypothetical protein